MKKYVRRRPVDAIYFDGSRIVARKIARFVETRDRMARTSFRFLENGLIDNGILIESEFVTWSPIGGIHVYTGEWLVWERKRFEAFSPRMFQRTFKEVQ